MSAVTPRRPRTMSFKRVAGMRSSLASALTLIPSGFTTSSKIVRPDASPREVHLPSLSTPRLLIVVAELRAFQTIVFPKPKKLGVDRFSSAGLSTPQKADSISPVPFRGFAGEGGQGSREAARIRWRDGLFVHKNHPAVLSPLLRPGFE